MSEDGGLSCGIGRFGGCAMRRAPSCAAARGHLQISKAEQPARCAASHAGLSASVFCERLWPLARWRTESDASVFRSAWLTDLPPIHWGFGGSYVDLPAYQLCEREAPSVRIPFSLGKCKRARCRVAVRLAAEFAARLASELKRQRVASLAARLIIALAAERLPRRLHR